jgi:hypothetical protein
VGVINWMQLRLNAGVKKLTSYSMGIPQLLDIINSSIIMVN